MVRKAKPEEKRLLEQVAAEAQDAWNESGLFDASRDKIDFHMWTRSEAHKLGELLSCAVYTARNGSTEEKNKTLAAWIRSLAQPYLVATSAFAEGFDYLYVRLVVNVNETESLILSA